MSETHKGIMAMVLACTVWGFAGLYWKALAHLPPLEVLAHRSFWSAVTFLLVLAFQRRLTMVWRALGAPRNAVLILCASLMISLNWFVFIWAVGSGQATEASLGYFLFPLVAVLAGRLLFGETLVALQWLAVALAAVAVAVLTLGLGVPPWIALVLASSFGCYGILKKRLDVGPVVSVTAEVLLIAPLALMVILTDTQSTGVLGNSARDAALLLFAGVLTATPLMLFSYATRRISLSTVGLLQYLNPSLQFFCAVTLLGEPLGFWHAVSFPVIWIALLLYSYASWSREKSVSRAASSVSISPTS